MKKEHPHIDDYFKAARNVPHEVSFEEVKAYVLSTEVVSNAQKRFRPVIIWLPALVAVTGIAVYYFMMNTPEEAPQKMASLTEKDETAQPSVFDTVVLQPSLQAVVQHQATAEQLSTPKTSKTVVLDADVPPVTTETAENGTALLPNERAQPSAQTGKIKDSVASPSIPQERLYQPRRYSVPLTDNSSSEAFEHAIAFLDSLGIKATLTENRSNDLLMAVQGTLEYEVDGETFVTPLQARYFRQIVVQLHTDEHRALSCVKIEIDGQTLTEDCKQ